MYCFYSYFHRTTRAWVKTCKMFQAKSVKAIKMKSKYENRVDLQAAILEMESHPDYEPNCDESTYFTCEESLNATIDNQPSNGLPDENARMKALICELKALDRPVVVVDRYL